MPFFGLVTLSDLNRLERKLMATAAEHAAALQAVADQDNASADAIKAKLEVLNTEIQALKDALTNQGTTPEVDAAFGNVKTAAQRVADAVV